MYPEAAVFTRSFYLTSRVDGQSILGARPLFCLTPNLYPHGFESALIHIRIRITDASSSTSTDTKYLSWAFDELANLTLNGVHSGEAYRRGFVVDNTSGWGMNVRERGSDLNESVDSHIMVRNLAMSQKYVKWTLFFTDTCNQRDRPGVKNVTAWLASEKWTEGIPGYYSLSPFDQQEFKSAMQAASGPHLYHQWQVTKKMLLCHIRDHNTVMGITTAIFNRDEYQGTTGNLCHNHLITAAELSLENADNDKDPTDDTENHTHTNQAINENSLRDIIRTSTLEIVKGPADIERLLENGVLTTLEEIQDITKQAETVLPHKCDNRCLRRVGPGEGPENFRCRKPHTVKDNPDPTIHSYVPFNHEYEPHFLEVMEEIGMYEPLAEGMGGMELGKFTRSCFEPRRHMPPCN